MRNIYLVGFMATGKTSVGREVARKKKRRFLDLDDLIELREARTISDIFTREGEQYFRKAEKKVLREACREDDFVIACGGGIMLDKDNVAIMKRTGKVICLSASPKVILERVSGSTARPLLDVADPKKQIELMLKFRTPYYCLADKNINTSGLSVKEVALKVLKLISVKK